MPLSRLSSAVGAVAVLVLAVACSGGGGGDESTATTDVRPTRRFCDVYLDYLEDASPSRLDAVGAAAGDDAQVADAVAAITDPASTPDRALAAAEDLDVRARERCQVEWTAGTQGAGSTEAAAAALVDALRSGDRLGAANIASANAVAAFEPWSPAPAARVGEVGTGTFVVVLSTVALAECQVDIGVVLACSVLEE